MTLTELATTIANEINRKSSLVTASVNSSGKLIITSKRSGTSTGLYKGSINNHDGALSQAFFSGGSPISRVVVIGNRGDTYFQRWDSMKTYPQDKEDENQVIEIASVMLESHINLDGRTDLDRGTSHLADIDWANYGLLNRIYSQRDNFLVGRKTDDEFNTDTYRSSITWSMQKAAGAEVDEWTHVTLASSLALDGDKGHVRALRRLGNSIIAFQDHGISEVLFNSRTQISTEQGVPVELANSGKVDGKRYITNKYGTSNKWSINEGKMGLYFVDNYNKVIARLGQSGIESLSTKHGLDVWVRNNSSSYPWSPFDKTNFVTYFDKANSDIYFINGSDQDSPCLVYNELLDSFTGFFDYSDVPMMTGVRDKFISFRNHHLWLQFEGMYGEFFGESKPFWITWRVSPNELTDKIWTNIDYQADFIEVLDDNGRNVVSEDNFIGPNTNDKYNPDRTFDTLTVWNEYQTTGEVAVQQHTLNNLTTYPDVRKKFKVWRLEIPRAIVTESNKFGLDRIRNHWAFIKLKKNSGNFGKEEMQLHDVVVRYFEE